MEVISYKCPKCSASLSYDIDKQKWVCDFCLSEFTKEDLKDIDVQGERGVLDEELIYHEHDKYEEDAIAYMCPSCGGKIITDKNTAATFCVYCHNSTIIASNLTDEHRPIALIPFQLKKEAAVEAVQNLCKKRPLLPKDFKEYAKRGEVSGLYVPFWLFSVDLDADLTARATKVSHWSDSNYSYTKTDTYQVERAGRVSFKNVPADGSMRMDDNLMQSLEPFDYSKLVNFTMEYLSGHYAESYDVEAEKAYSNASSRFYKTTDSMIRSTVIAYSYVNVLRQNIKVRREVHKNVMLPVWILMTNYKGKSYIFAMNGQTGKITGRLPLSIGLCAAWFGGIFAIVTLICFIGVMFI